MIFSVWPKQVFIVSLPDSDETCKEGDLMKMSREVPSRQQCFGVEQDDALLACHSLTLWLISFSLLQPSPPSRLTWLFPLQLSLIDKSSLARPLRRYILFLLADLRGAIVIFFLTNSIALILHINVGNHPKMQNVFLFGKKKKKPGQVVKMNISFGML